MEQIAGSHSYGSKWQASVTWCYHFLLETEPSAKGTVRAKIIHTEHSVYLAHRRLSISITYF